jgi:hypothetical protein
MESIMSCPKCKVQHAKAEDLITKAVQAGAIAYVDALCPWCRFVFSAGRALNSPIGAILCGIAIGTVLIRIKDSMG